MSLYYDWDGNIITFEQWTNLFRRPRHIALTRFKDAKRSVSTVYLGMDHSFGDGPPLIFESMAFEEDGEGGWLEDVAVDRYATRREALRGHHLMVNMVVQEHGWKVKEHWDESNQSGSPHP